MKKILLLSSVLLICGCESMSYEATWQAAHVIDVLQTANGIAGNPECMREEAWDVALLIGEEPEKDDVYKWGIAAAITTHLLYKWIDNTGRIKPKAKSAIKAVHTGYKLNVVYQNHEKGIRIDGNNVGESDCDRFETVSTGITIAEW